MGQQQHTGVFNAASLAEALVPSPQSLLDPEGDDVVI